MTSGQVLPSLTSDTHATTGLTVQLSASSVTTDMSAAGTSPMHCTFIGAGLLAVGSVSSLTVIVWVTVMLLLQSSVILWVLVLPSGQLLPSLTSDAHATTGLTVQ